ncbi:MAG: transposase family protein [Anaerolineaceae bacterium]|nr:transposase family protein [Anaerolineaceae bacterium]
MNEFSIQHLFADLEDPRQAHNAVISNAQSWTEIQAFGEAKQDWLKQYLTLENGIPSHDTIMSATGCWMSCSTRIVRASASATARRISRLCVKSPYPS